MKFIICDRCWCAVIALLPVLLPADMLPVSWSSAEGSSDSDSLASVSVVDISSSSLALSRFDASPPARYLVKLSCCIMYNKMPCLVLRGMFYKKFRSFVRQFQFQQLGIQDGLYRNHVLVICGLELTTNRMGVKVIVMVIQGYKSGSYYNLGPSPKIWITCAKHFHKIEVINNTFS